ncbi:MAG TPA: type II toxin-antitoxin system Phd/YefM family antitoxin [Candidatus Angelobacter sp.]|nr:type II toxin-antitoxin system Phd/YefM family antitoxin [Candidatus Angelobacter sp.]
MDITKALAEGIKYIDFRKAVSAHAFKTRCLAIIDQVHETGEPVLITKRGRPIAELVPVKEKKLSKFLGRLQGVVRIVGDIETPIEPAKAWKALR